MKVRIEALISTAGNDEDYVGKHLGMALIGRPFKRMVVTFEDDLSDPEIDAIQHGSYQSLPADMHNNLSLTVHGIRVLRH